MNDQSVRGANQLTTTFLDALGILLLAAGVGWALWSVLHPAAGLFAAGVVVLLLSMAAQRQSRPKPTKPKPAEDDFLPGPDDPGPLHVMGR